MNNFVKIKKEVIEEHLCNNFLISYNVTYNTNYKIIEKRECPDFIVRNSDGLEFGIEITRLYTDEKGARILNGVENEPHGIFNVLESYRDALNLLLEKKIGVSKKYKYIGKIILVIHVPLPTGDETIFDDYEYKKDNKFSNIFLLFSYTAPSPWVIKQI